MRAEGGYLQTTRICTRVKILMCDNRQRQVEWRKEEC